MTCRGYEQHLAVVDDFVDDVVDTIKEVEFTIGFLFGKWSSQRKMVIQGAMSSTSMIIFQGV